MAHLTVNRPSTTPVEITIVPANGSSKSAFIVLNGVKALEFTAEGHMRRLKGLPSSVGVRRLPDGRVAIKPSRSRR